jgi:ABC-type transporter Mla subunit MlaD
MVDHELAERLAGLASRVDNLGHLTIGEESRTLEDQQDRLAKLVLVAIAQDMDATNKKYQNAVASVKAATAAIGDADKKIENVAKIISIVAKALDAAETILKKAAVG